MEEKKEFIFNLEKPIGYGSKDGVQVEATFITLLPPTMKQHSQASSLKQSIVKMVREAAERADDDDDDDDEKEEGKEDKKEEGINQDDPVTAAMVVATIYGSDAVDVNVAWEQAKDLFKNGVAMVDGEQKLTAPLIAKMDPDDFEKMVGEYVANFILA